LDAGSIAAQMQKIYKEEPLRNRHIALGFKHVQKFDWQKSAVEMAGVINELLQP
jgi:hypothetical protein